MYKYRNVVIRLIQNRGFSGPLLWNTKDMRANSDGKGAI